MATAPVSLSIRTYRVGFGDCFLLSFKYKSGEKHVLIDFGSMAFPPDAPKTRMMDIAGDIKTRSGGKLTAVVATHRHKDHISGFEPKGGKGPGDIIRALKPELVMQPWTEDTKLAEDATGPAGKHIAALASMHAIAAHAVAGASKMRAKGRQVHFLGEDNIKNPGAVRNLRDMAKNEYVYCGARSGLEKLLSGVKVHVLGPPTVDQSDKIKKQTQKDKDEFWHFQAKSMARSARGAGKAAIAFPRHVMSRGPSFPAEARWLIYHARLAADEQTLQIVTMLDGKLNNTSIILLFQVGKKILLFPGDAQIENWRFALDQKGKYQKLLSDVNLYKVGHHGSLNATPKSLWKLFKNRNTKAAARRLVSLMSTEPGHHGKEESRTEVPRKTLKKALASETTLFTTESLKGKKFFFDTVVTF